MSRVTTIITGPDGKVTRLILTWTHIGQALVGSIGALEVSD
jgi:hypothetical protein